MTRYSLTILKWHLNTVYSDTNDRKKLLLALQAMNIGGGNAIVDEPSGRLDYNWVMRWLDDLGLPQYKVNATVFFAVFHFKMF